jgi:cell division septum initiation protein DivIVA
MEVLQQQMTEVVAFMKSVDKRLNQLGDNVAKLGDDVAKLGDDVAKLGHDVAIIKEEMVIIKEIGAETSTSVNSLKERTQKIEQDLSELKGATNERYLRKEISRLFGERFSQAFVIIQGLSGIVRLINLPKRFDELYFPRDSDKHTFDREESDVQRQQSAIMKLIDEIYKKQGDGAYFKKLCEQYEEPVSSELTTQLIRSISSGTAADTEEIKLKEKLRMENVQQLIGQCKSKQMKNTLLQYCKQNKPNQLRRIADDSGFGIGMSCSIVPGLEKEKFEGILDRDIRIDIFIDCILSSILINSHQAISSGHL